VVTGVEGIRAEQAKLTFAMARHAAVDLAQVVNVKYQGHRPNRLPPERLGRLRQDLAAEGVRLRDDAYADEKLAKMRSLYEPYLEETARRLLFTLPPWFQEERIHDNWQGGPWDRTIQAQALGQIGRATPAPSEEHF
jgi:hypothetical protein